MISVQNEKLVDFDQLVELVLEYISDILTNFQTSSLFSFRDIPILTRNMT